MTAAEELVLVDAAIERAMVAQSYSAYGRSKNLASYKDLVARKDALETRIEEAAGNAGSMCSLVSLEGVR